VPDIVTVSPASQSTDAPAAQFVAIDAVCRLHGSVVVVVVVVVLVVVVPPPPHELGQEPPPQSGVAALQSLSMPS